MKMRLLIGTLVAFGAAQAHAQAPASVMVVRPWGGANLTEPMPFSDFEAALGVAGSGAVTSAEHGARPSDGRSVRRVALDSAGTMWVEEDAAGKVVIGEGSTRLFSVDGRGNVRARGKIKGHARP